MSVGGSAIPWLRDLSDTQRTRLFLCGLALYALSFFLVAIYDPQFKGKFLGYHAAFLSLVLPLADISDRFRANAPSPVLNLVNTIALLASGLINPIFVFYALVSPFRPRDLTVRFLRILIPSLIPFTWVFFLSNWMEFRPREGYFFWIAGIAVVVLFSRSAESD